MGEPKRIGAPLIISAAADEPLLAALLARLPAPGQPFPGDRRANWLRMWQMALDDLYGVAEDMPAFLPGRTASEMAGGQPANRTASEIAAMPLPVTGSEPDRYYIDAKGHARRDPGRVPITVNDVPTGEVIWDERPLGMRDLDSIVWADGAWPPGSLPPLNFASG